MKSWFSGLGILLLVFQLESQAQKLRTILPDYVNIQHAGSVGWMSVGIDYDLMKQRARVGTRYGYVPPGKGGPLHLVSASFFYEPWEWKPNRNLSINPLDVGVKVSYHFGDDFYTRLPSRYPENYYWWKSAVRPHLATQTSLTWHLAENKGIRSVTGYAELNTNELYLVSYILNHRSFGVSDIVKLGLGVRVGF